jgi:hypothetical protein
MSDATQEPRRTGWLECGGCTHLFRAFRLAIHPTKLILAFCCVLGTYITGRVLDAAWPASSMPIVVMTGDRATSELAMFISPDGGRASTKQWVGDQLLAPSQVRRTGPFKLLLDQARTTIDAGTSAIIHADFNSLLDAVKSAVKAKLWLLVLHPVYAVIFSLISLAIWSFFGGALCRVAALHATRDERIGLRDALAFSQSKFSSFFAAPLMPAGIVALFAVLLFVGGLIGAIPAIGEIVVGVLFFLALIAGIIIAFVVVGGVGGSGLMFPTIAVEGSDAFDALSRSYSYVYQRPWRTAFYAFVSAAYGGICLVFVKFFVRLALWATCVFAGISMNWGSAFLRGDAGQPPASHGKLDAIWQGPSLTGNSTFWGSFEVHNLAYSSWFAQLWFYLWIFTIMGFVGAFMVSFFYSANTLIYLLLRREVDATDLEDVYLEETPAGESVVPPPAAGSVERGSAQPADTSPPVIEPPGL